MRSLFLDSRAAELHNFPWKHYVIDNFLPQNDFKRFQKELCSVKKGYHKRENDEFDLNFMFLPNLELAKFFLGKKFKNYLEKTTKTKLELYEKGLIQLRKMDHKSPAFKPHVDNQKNERSLVCLYYISPNWISDKGGELVLHRSKKCKWNGKFSKVVEPIENRMVLFFADNNNWHSVRKIKDWQRYSIISEWIVRS